MYKFIFSKNAVFGETETNDKGKMVLDFIKEHKDACYMSSDIVGLDMSEPFVYVGALEEDVDYIEAAEVAIAYGGVVEIAQSVLDRATHATYSEVKLCQFLRQLL